VTGFVEDDTDGSTAELLLRRAASVREDAGGDCDGRTTERILEASHRRLGEKRRPAQQHGRHEGVSCELRCQFCRAKAVSATSGGRTAIR